MRPFRLLGALGALVALSAVIACGGGGGTSTPPVGAPSSNPGGSPGPGGSSSPPSSGSPSPTSTPRDTPVPTRTPISTATPSPVPTSTAPPTPYPSPSGTPNPTLTVTTGHGEINGTDDQFTGGIGKEIGDGDYPDGGQGPVNTTFGPDNVPCLAQMYDGPVPPGYHVHAFLGIYYNGTEIAMPDGVGIADPEGDITYQGIPNWTQYSYDPNNPGKSGCFYQIHTHDPSGTIHIESSNPNSVPLTGTIYTLGDVLALWGIPISSTQFGPFSGQIQVFTSGQIPRFKQGEVGSNTYTLYNGDMRNIALYTHEVIWVLIGTGNPTYAALPNVGFWDEY